MIRHKTDVVIVGGGPGGYVAAIRAAQLGLKTILVEENHLGGICLNWGCIPTKALLHVSETYHAIKHASDMGISVKDVSIDLSKIVARSRKVASTLNAGIVHLMKKHQIQVIEGRGMLNGKGAVKVSNREGEKIADIEAAHIILATGARARTLPGLVPDGTHIVTYKDAMTPKTLPETLLVVGSGAIGVEFASFYQTLGSKVTIIEVADRILPVEDAEISALAKRDFERQGMEIHTATTVQSLIKKGDKVEAVLVRGGDANTQKKSYDRVILAVGIVANTEKLGLESTNIQLEKGHVVTDAYGRTDEAGVYAIGDMTGSPWLAHKASHEAVICVEKIAGFQTHAIKKENIPGCTYCHPQIASVGLTQAAAEKAGYDVRIGRFPYSANGKAIAMGETSGLVKTIFDTKTGALLGAHIIGCDATEMINGYLVGKTMEATEADFMNTIFPHPTLSEMMHESVLHAYDRGLHV